MQSLWPRAARIQCFCNCSACKSTVGTVARRIATASTRGRLGRPDVFTVFSSTLALSAAMMDSAMKEERNRQWDKAIGKAKAEVEAAELDLERRLAKLVVCDGEAQTDQEISSLPIKRFRKSKWIDILRWAAVQERQRVAAGFEDWRGVPLELLRRLSNSELQKLLSNKYILHDFYGGKNCSEMVANACGRDLAAKKLRTQEWSMLKLVIRLLSHVSSDAKAATVSSKSSEPINCLLPNDRQHWKHVLEDSERRLMMLKEESRFSSVYDTFPSPQNPKYEFSPWQREDELKIFNIHLQDALREVTSSLRIKLATICAKLLEMRTAPSIHTYNLLLVRFCQLKEKSLVHAVFESMRETHLRPNEVTDTTMLRFFAATEDKIGFYLYVNMMNGYNQGLALADPGRMIHPIARSRYRWFGQNNYKAAEKARMNEDVYTALIIGYIRFSKRNYAMLYYEQMICEGWKPTVEVLQVILEDCYKAWDFASGFRVFELLRSIATNSSQILQDVYGSIQELCKRCNKWNTYQLVKIMKEEDGIVDLAPSAQDLDAISRLKQMVSQRERTFKALALVMMHLTEQVASSGCTEDTNVMKYDISAKIAGDDQQEATMLQQHSYTIKSKPSDQQQSPLDLQRPKKMESLDLPGPLQLSLALPLMNNKHRDFL